MMPLPAWRAGADAHENWRASPWGQPSADGAKNIAGSSCRERSQHDG
jgi:hypothetical protein